MKNDRGSRLNETRAIETRDYETEKVRPTMNLVNGGILDVPDSIKKDKFEYYWARRGLKSAYDSSLDILYSKGWRPVERSRDPSTFMIQVDTSDPVYSKYYCKGDVILLEREKELCDQEKEYNKTKAIEHVTTSEAYKFNKQNPKGIINSVY